MNVLELDWIPVANEQHQYKDGMFQDDKQRKLFLKEIDIGEFCLVSSYCDALETLDEQNSIIEGLIDIDVAYEDALTDVVLLRKKLLSVEQDSFQAEYKLHSLKEMSLFSAIKELLLLRCDSEKTKGI